MSLSELFFLNCLVGNYYICDQMLLHLWPNVITLATFITFVTSYYICAFNVSLHVAVAENLLNMKNGNLGIGNAPSNYEGRKH